MEKIYTFLFSDIEGSTRLWEQQPQIMSSLLTDHNRIMQQAIESNRGKVFKTVGDAFCAAFPTALQGIKAAIESQQALTQAAEALGEATGAREQAALKQASEAMVRALSRSNKSCGKLGCASRRASLAPTRSFRCAMTPRS